jgi:peptide/nickel transport system permease protein
MMMESGPLTGPVPTDGSADGTHPRPAELSGVPAKPNPAGGEFGGTFWRRFTFRRPLAALILQRLGLSVGLLFAVSLMIFGGVEALPGDFATTYLGQSATPQAVENIRKDLGLDQPATTRYFKWLGGALQGDFGKSWASKNSVSEQIGKRLGNSLFLAFFAAIISVPLAVGLGMLAVQYRNRLPDKIINVI